MTVCMSGYKPAQSSYDVLLKKRGRERAGNDTIKYHARPGT